MTGSSAKKVLILLIVLLMLLPFIQVSAGDDGRCPYGLSYWSNTPAAWTVNSLMLGSQFYSQAELIPFMLGNTPNDASAQLAAQLAAAKLNIASGLDPVPVTSAILTADTLLSSYPGRLPYNVDPASPAGQAMLTTAAVLNNFNLGLQTPGCSLTPTPTGTLTVTPTLTPTPTGTLTITPIPGRGPVTIIIEGPVQQININIITIYDIDIEINPTDPILTVIEIGDILRVIGNIDDDDDDDDDDRGGRIYIVAITVIIVDIDVFIQPGGTIIWRDRGDCSNPPPDWAPANGWRRRCQQPAPQPGGGGRGGDDDDDDDDDDD
jgi:hypothetical protein